jgi:phage gp46-like protein
MIDNPLHVNPINDVSLDWLIKPVSDVDPLELADAVGVALGSDRLANLDDPLPNIGDDDRRGWWGDFDAESVWSAWPLGSRLWLLGRGKITGAGAKEGATVARVRAYIQEAILPFIDHKIASKIEITVDRVSTERIDAGVTLYRGPLPAIDLKFQYLWERA